MNKKCEALLHRAVRTTGTYDPTETLGYIEEDLTQDEYETCESFLMWCHQNHQTFGWGNFKSQFAKFEEDEKLGRWMFRMKKKS